MAEDPVFTVHALWEIGISKFPSAVYLPWIDGLVGFLKFKATTYAFTNGRSPKGEVHHFRFDRKLRAIKHPVLNVGYHRISDNERSECNFNNSQT